MSCVIYEPLLSAYLHRELGAEEAHDVARHLKNCIVCDRELHELVDVVQQLRQVDLPEVPADLLASVEDQAYEPAPVRWQAWIPVLAMAGVAALILFGLHWGTKSGVIRPTVIVKRQSSVPIHREAMVWQRAK